MKWHFLVLFGLAGAFAFATNIGFAHPGSGIVVDERGHVFFQDSAARTIWQINRDGKVSACSDKLGGHWMALDTKDRFARSTVKLVERIPPTRVSPAILVADGGAPIAINSEGQLFYGLGVLSDGKVTVGMTRIFPDGKQEQFAPALAQAIEKLGVTGLASGRDGTVYAACLTDVIKLQTNGTFTRVASCTVIRDCDADAPTPFLRGLDVDADGTVYAAACGCRCVVKISPAGKVEIVLKAERPWSPTGVAVHQGDVYVLEYTHANGALKDGWLPRVRKLAHDGTVMTLATISEAQQRGQPNRLIVP
ncbi:MAG TPA: hypothetical protein VK846_05645 [Candidatus Limnocylindria bacterium]|nr:hypothetical protein [Candidatus Limnocylindria bacterium]